MGTSIIRMRTRDLKERIAFSEWRKCSPPGEPEVPELCIGKPSGFHSQTAPPPPDRLHPCQPHSARPGIERPVASLSPKKEEDTSGPLEIAVGERRWYVVDHNEATSHEPKRISNECARVLRPEPHVHDVDGACQWRLVKQTDRDRL